MRHDWLTIDSLLIKLTPNSNSRDLNTSELSPIKESSSEESLLLPKPKLLDVAAALQIGRNLDETDKYTFTISD